MADRGGKLLRVITGPDDDPCMRGIRLESFTCNEPELDRRQSVLFLVLSQLDRIAGEPDD